MGPTGSCPPTAWVLKTHSPQEHLHLPEEAFQPVLLSVGPRPCSTSWLCCTAPDTSWEVARVVWVGQRVQSPCVVIVKPCDMGEI